MTLSDFIETLVVAANLGIFLLIVLTISERLRSGWGTVEREVQEIVARREFTERDRARFDESVEEERRAVSALDDQIDRAKEDLAALNKRHAEVDLPFIYTASPVEGIDPRFPSWRLLAHNPQIGQRSMQLSETAFQWNEGRFYEIPAPNHVVARSILERMLPASDGFFVRVIDDERSGVA